MLNNKFSLGLVLLSIVSVAQAESRDYISVVGSSTVYPFATVVAEKFGKASKFKTPKIEATGTGGGMKLFCSGVGTQYPDIANASRRIKKSEVDDCAKKGVKEIIEVKVGNDGIAIANSKKSKHFNLSKRDLYLALAHDVPDPKGGQQLVANPYKTWNQVNPKLPNQKIEVLGPPPTSGTRDAFNELAIEGGCETFDWLKALKKSDEKKHKAVCMTIREDGAYIEAGENDNMIVQKLNANPNALGVFGFSFLDQNSDKVQAAHIDGVVPEFDTIADGSYGISRPLYIYVKKAHIGKVAGIEQFVAEFTSEKAWGDEGYLADRGMIPLPKKERAKFADDAKKQKTLSM